MTNRAGRPVHGPGQRPAPQQQAVVQSAIVWLDGTPATVTDTGTVRKARAGLDLERREFVLELGPLRAVLPFDVAAELVVVGNAANGHP